jgi:hypothetical protein
MGEAIDVSRGGVSRGTQHLPKDVEEFRRRRDEGGIRGGRHGASPRGFIDLQHLEVASAE